MSAIVTRPILQAAISPSSFLGRIRAAEPRFFALAVLMLAAMAPTGFAAFADPREFQGVDIWIKPLKFQFALFVYFGTLAFFAMFLPSGTTAKTWYRLFTGAVAIGAAIEIIWIGGASALGTASHFNQSPFGTAIYSAMGATAVLITTASAVYAFQIARNSATGLSSAVKEALVIGLALVLPLTLITAGTMSQMGSHFIGGAMSDAGGVPPMGWSRDGGDLRVAHFFSTHAMHFIPAFSLILAWFFGSANRVPVRIFAGAYLSFVCFLFAQALMGEPFLPALG